MANRPAGVLVNYQCRMLYLNDIVEDVENLPTNAFLFQIMARNKIGLHYFVPTTNLLAFHRYIYEVPHFSKYVVVKLDAISEDERTAFDALSVALGEADIPTSQHPEMIANMHYHAARFAQELGNTENRIIPYLVDIAKIFMEIIDRPVEVGSDEDEDYEEDEWVEDDDEDSELLNDVVALSIGEDTPTPASESSSFAALEKRMMDEESVEECCICLVEMAADTEVTVLPCNHIFHGGCIVDWLRIKNVCPLCRFIIPATEDDDD